MSAYNQVPRLTTANPLKMHHQHHRRELGHHQRDTGPPLEHEAANYQVFRTSQRKWRVLVSIGLLLPALAAIIGIVAWTISIEVANGGTDRMAAASAMAQVRRAERAHQQQQIKLSQAAAYAALAAAHRPKSSAPVQSANPEQPVSAPLVQQQPQQNDLGGPQGGRSSDIADEKQQAQQRSTRTSQSVITSTTQTPTRQPQQQQQQQQAKRQAAAGAAKISESSPASTTTDQVETLPNASRDLSSSESSKSDEANSGGQKAQTRAETAQQDDAQQSDGRDSDGKTAGATELSADVEASPAKMESEAQSPEAALEEQAAEPKDEVEQRKPFQEEAEMKKPSAKKNQKSRWLPTGDQTSDSVATNKKSASAKQKHFQSGANKSFRPKSLPAVKTNSEYRLLLTTNSDETSDGADEKTPVEQPPKQLERSDNEKDCASKARDPQPTEASLPDETTGQDEQVSFEAIASAISKSLSDNQTGKEQSSVASKDTDAPARAMAELLSEAIASNKDERAAPEKSEPSGSPLEEETSAVAAKDAPDASASRRDDETAAVSKRRRTTGEHLAEVIDHIVEKRHHQRLARFGERAQGGELHQRQAGPQIVVVAPVGPSGALLKARSLTKEPAANSSQSTQSKTEGKSAAAAKKPLEPAKKRPARVGGRLLGTDEAASSPVKGAPAVKYSERVEVIEDDDSSALLEPQPAVKAVEGESAVGDEVSREEEDDEEEERESGARNEMPAGLSSRQQADLAAISHEQLSSVHVSSHSSEPRSRSPRHKSLQMFERYAPLQQQHQQQHQQQQKLYSAEQLIMEHVLKSQGKPMNEQRSQPKKPVQETGNATVASPTAAPSFGSLNTTSAPTAAGSQQRTAASSPQRTQPSQQREQMEQSKAATDQNEVKQLQAQQEQQQANQEAFASMQPVQVPALFIQQSGPAHQSRFQQIPLHNFQQDPYQTMESQQQQQQVQMVRSFEGANPPNEARDQIQPQPQPQQAQQQINQNDQQQAQQAPQLPVFADQEIQVPAHMAESVIRDLQQAPSTVTGMLNGQPALFQAQPTMMAQVPQQAPHHHQNQHLHQQQMFMQQQRTRHHLSLAESQQRPMFAAAQQQQQQQQPLNSYLTRPTGYGPLALMSRLASARRQQEQMQLQEQMQRDRQVLASRASAGKDEAKQQAQQQGSLIDSVKALGPKSLIQPMAQMALKNLFSTLGQQAAAQQAQADAVEQRRNQPRSSLASPAAAAPQQASPQQVDSGPEALQSSGSSPVGAMAAPAAEPASGRSMRSLPIGAQAPVSQQQLQMIGGDQEVQESYGQMPAYHMPSGGNYGGGGGNYDNYQGDHDKKTKGITFHFGGGPIGGGTQLITSPMGIFKHLMIPLLPNPRVNLNGKVVFGVVLEKSTAFGPPPKKKHKFWG